MSKPLTDEEFVRSLLAEWSEDIEMIDFVTPLILNRIQEAREEVANDIHSLFDVHDCDITGMLLFDKHAARRSSEEISRAQEYNTDQFWMVIKAQAVIKAYIDTNNLAELDRSTK